MSIRRTGAFLSASAHLYPEHTGIFSSKSILYSIPPYKMHNDQYCFISRNAIEKEFEINYFQHWNIGIYDQPSFWLFMNGEEEDGFMNDEDNYQIVKLSEIVFNRPLIREYIDEPVGSSFCYNPEFGRIENWTEKRTLTFDRRIHTPNAAGVKLEPMVWLRYFPGTIVSTFIAICFAVPAVWHHPAWILFSIIFLVRGIVTWAQIYEHFKLGEARPGVIVRTRPCLLAVEGQIHDKGRPKRILKVIRIKLNAIGEKQIEIGDKMAVATLYQNPTWYSSIFDISPMPINYATNDLDKINSMIGRFHATEWETLIQAASLLHPPYKAGVYEVPDTQA